MGFIDDLTEFGLTRQEATVYNEMLKQGAMTGYEVSKVTGISKSNAYAALSALVTKGAAVMEEGEAKKYIANSVEDFSENCMRNLSTVAKRLVKEQPKKTEIEEGYITISSERHIKDKMLHMLKDCELRLYVLAESALLEEFREELDKLVSEGKKVVILTDKGFELKGAVIYRTDVTEGQIRLITDSTNVLTGELTGSEEDTCLYSGKRNLVEIMKEALKNKIELLEKA